MELKHSGLGIASFVVSLLAAVMMFVFIGLATIAAISNPGGFKEESPEVMVIGLGIIGDGMVLVLAFALGIAGLVQQDRNKLFAIFGTAISGLAIFGTIGLMIVGLVVG